MKWTWLPALLLIGAWLAPIEPAAPLPARSTLPASAARKFLGDDWPEKRPAAIERLLDSPGYVNHFTSIWLSLLMPEAGNDFNKRYMLPGVHTWLRQHFADNTPYDQIVRELIALPM